MGGAGTQIYQLVSVRANPQLSYLPTPTPLSF